jgi:hypothetical protein
MQMPGRDFTTTGKRSKHSINGQERSDELNDNLTTAEFWQYDSRIGRRWNVDPVLKIHESPYMTFANNPIWCTDLNGSDTTKYYNNDGKLLMTVGNGKSGYNRAMVVKDDKVKAIQEYASKYSTVLNSKTGISNNVAVDNSLKGYGDLYDLNSFTKFYEDNKGKYNVQSMRGRMVDDMTSITVNGKPVSKAFIKNLKGAEATALVSRVGGIFTVDVASTKSDNDAFSSTRPYNSDMSNATHIHLHPIFNMNFEYRGKNKSGSFWGYEEAKGMRDGSISGDLSQNAKDGRSRGLPRTVVVSAESIRLITGSPNETIYIKR